MDIFFTVINVCKEKVKEDVMLLKPSLFFLMQKCVNSFCSVCLVIVSVSFEEGLVKKKKEKSVGVF